MRILLITLSVAILIGVFSYNHLSKLNRSTELRLQLPQLKAQRDHLLEIREQLEMQIQEFESPQNLIEYWLSDKFSYLQALSPEDIVTQLPTEPKQNEEDNS